MKIKHEKDFWSGLMFIGFGLLVAGFALRRSKVVSLRESGEEQAEADKHQPRPEIFFVLNLHCRLSSWLGVPGFA
jgi:hypothetical protein